MGPGPLLATCSPFLFVAASKKQKLGKNGILSKSDDFCCFCNFSEKTNGGIFLKYKTPGGAAGDKSRVLGNPDFGKKSRFENKLAFFAKFLKIVARSSNVVALTFRCGSRYGSPGIDCLEK